MTPPLKAVPLKKGEIALLEKPELAPSSIRKLLKFYHAYHELNLAFFIRIRDQWHADHPGAFFPGLCANVNAITGLFRPEEEQKLWGIGDTRAFGIWAEFLLLDRVPAGLKKGVAEYCRVIAEGVRKRHDMNDGWIPFLSDWKTEKPDPGPLNRRLAPEEANFTTAFAASSFARYGLLQNDRSLFGFGMSMLERVVKAIEAGRFVPDVGSAPAGVTLHGPRMITLGVVVEILECIKALEAKGVRGFSGALPALIRVIGPFTEFVMKNHFRSDPAAFWEQGDGRGSPVINAQGKKVVDPGHATECAGFLAEAMHLVPADWRHGSLDRKKVIEAALAMHLFADRIGFSKKGVMYKYVDLDTGAPLPDTQALNAGGRLTAPWWNVREHCAAALRLYTLTRDKRLLSSYQKAQRASYLFYTNRRIDGQMVQTLDPESGKALDIAPSTGNLDAMHDPRARLRETMCLEELLKASE